VRSNSKSRKTHPVHLNLIAISDEEADEKMKQDGENGDHHRRRYDEEDEEEDGE